MTTAILLTHSAAEEYGAMEFAIPAHLLPFAQLYDELLAAGSSFAHRIHVALANAMRLSVEVDRALEKRAEDYAAADV